MKNEWAAVGGCEKLHATNAGKKKEMKMGKPRLDSICVCVWRCMGKPGGKPTKAAR